MLNQRGDTIIEVVMSMAIFAGIITAAHQIANKALHLGHEARERNQAAYLQQKQAEALRYFRDNYGWDVFADQVDNYSPAYWASRTLPERCNDPSVPAGSVFHMARSGNDWQVTQGIPTGNGVFTQCVIPQSISGSADAYRLNIITTWAPIGTNGSRVNRTLMTTDMTNIRSLILEEP